MPTASTKNHPDANETELNGRVELARRRIAEGFYNRPEVRRTVAALLLSELARPKRRAGSPRPETA